MNRLFPINILLCLLYCFTVYLFRIWISVFIVRPHFLSHYLFLFHEISFFLLVLLSQRDLVSYYCISFHEVIQGTSSILSKSLKQREVTKATPQCLSFRPCSLTRPASFSSRWVGPAQLCSDWPASGSGPAGRSVPARGGQSVWCGSGSRKKEVGNGIDNQKI